MADNIPSEEEMIGALRTEIAILEAKPAAMVAKQHIAALKAALQRLEASRWRPIEEAPKDGNEVDLWWQVAPGNGYRATDCYWSKMERYWRQLGDVGQPRMAGEPTHFMLLPPPPSTTSEGE